jgi:hypothetical protein
VGYKSTDVSEELASVFMINYDPIRDQREAGSKQNLFYDPEDGGDMFLRNVS